MSNLDNILNTRLAKLQKLKDKGINPYPPKVPRDFDIATAIADFEKLEKAGKEISLAGRVMSLRGQGGLLFFDLNDGAGKFQALLKKDEIGAEQFDLFESAVDIGDFVGVRGKFFTTKRGEKTMSVSSWIMAAKSLLPLPEKWHGLQDEEEKLRKRYLDIIFNKDVREIIEKRAKFWASTRNFLISKNFLEVETPILETTAGGADAKPFKTHYNALDMDVYLRISMGELWQKRLMVAGLNKTFEIGRQFRNEGMSREHLQDYTQMEFYWAYANYKDGMALVEEMYKYIVKETFGGLAFKINGFDIDFGKSWPEIDYVATIKEKLGIDVIKATEKEIRNKLADLKVEYGEDDGKGRLIDHLWKTIRKNIGGPAFLVNHPVLVSPLAKRKGDNAEAVERFQVILAGSEMGNGYSELNDPVDQAERFAEQAKLREAGDEEAQMNDADFVEALGYGMPPTCGFGFSERLFSFLADKPARECQIFPLLRPKK